MKKKILLLGLLAIVLAGVLQFNRSDLWRFRAARLKLTGGLPEITWQQITSSLEPAWRPAGDRHPDLVTLAERADHGLCDTLWNTPVGPLWGRLEDGPVLDFLLKEQLVDRIYHNRTVAVQPGDVVLDVGGHLGTFTRFALDQGARQVIVFEPEPTNLRCLEQTFDREIREQAVILVRAAAWKERGVLQFAIQHDDAAQARVVDQGSIEVQAVTIDDTVDQLALNAVDFVKMDIEGAEREALAGAAQDPGAIRSPHVIVHLSQGRRPASDFGARPRRSPPVPVGRDGRVRLFLLTGSGGRVRHFISSTHPSAAGE